MTALALRSILVPDMPEGVIRPSTEIRECVCTPHPVDIDTGFEPSPAKAPRQVFGLRPEHRESITRISEGAISWTRQTYRPRSQVPSPLRRLSFTKLSRENFMMTAATNACPFI